MHQRLSIRQRIACCIIAFCAAALYVGFYFYTVGAEWAAKEGDRPPIPLWFQNFSSDVILFPFGFVPAIAGIWSFILNILFWSIVGAGIGLFIYRRARHLPAVVVIAAWLMFIVSFFLPATNVVETGGTAPGTPLTGWQAFTSSLEVLAVQPLIIIAEPRTLLFLTFPFINLAMLLAPVVVLAWDDSWLLIGFFFLFGILPWFFPKDVTGDLFVGFYLWDLSFFMMIVGCVLVSINRKGVSPGLNADLE